MESEFYRTDYNRRGLLVIVNNRSFHPDTELAERSGTEVDAGCLRNDFRRLGFVVRRYENQSTRQMISIMNSVGEADHSDCGAFAVAFLTHGENGILYGYDGPVEIERLLKPLKTCRTLTGKPKIVIIQACRGEKLDQGTPTLITDASKPSQSQPLLTQLPREADFLIAYSSVSGYVSYRWGEEGSWFIQALHKVLTRLSSTEPVNLADVFLRVSNLVALKYQTEDGEKQMPCTVSTLRKKFYLQAIDESQVVVDMMMSHNDNVNFQTRSISICDEPVYQASTTDVYDILRRFNLVDVRLTNTSGDGVRTPLSWQQMKLNPLFLGRCNAVYRRCDYKAPDGQLFPVFVAEECGLPPTEFRTTGHSGRLHMGAIKADNNAPRPSKVFFVIHPNSWNPYQHRFINDSQTKLIHEETEKLIWKSSLVQYWTKSLIGKSLFYLG